MRNLGADSEERSDLGEEADADESADDASEVRASPATRYPLPAGRWSVAGYQTGATERVRNFARGHRVPLRRRMPEVEEERITRGSAKRRQ
jgi:hypothetical protein